jgi:4-alpha-glucanotransferase
MVIRNRQWFPERRQAGVCLHLTSLPGSGGIGEIGEAAFQFIDALEQMNLGFWQFLPTGPTGFGNSPYQSLSTFAGNEMLIDMTGLVRLGLLTGEEIQPLTRLPESRVNYGALIPVKSALLGLAADRFAERASSQLKSQFDLFQDQHDDPWLHDYALFRVLKSRHGEKEWLRWPARYRCHDENALRQLESQAWDQLLQVKTIQFLFCRQWQEMQQYATDKGVVLFGDMPIYVALDSADAWASRDLLRLDKNDRPELVAGVPPDYFSENGQLWGNPVYDWDAHAAVNYTWWISRFRRALQMTELVRVDHFRGFESFFAIARTAKTARNGEWRKGPGDALFDALYGALGELPIVAEDLGVITPEVDALRDRYKIPGMKVLQFEVLRKDFDIINIPDNCVCYTGTHDNDTIAGWYRGNPGGDDDPSAVRRTRRLIRDHCNGRAATIYHDMIRLAFSSNARLAITPLQDFLGLGSAARLNTPGTATLNWCWRTSQKVFDSDFHENVARLVEDSGRSGIR